MSYRHSEDSARRPLSDPAYAPAGSYEPKYGGADQGYGQGYRAPASPKKSRKWLWIIVAIVVALIIAGAVAGGVIGTRKSNNNTSSGSNSGSGSSTAVAGGATGTDAHGNPVYPTSTAAVVAPSFASNSTLSCGDDPYSFGGNLAVRTDHPRLFAPAYKWSCLPRLIANDPYMASWNATIFANATRFAAMDPTPYNIDGGLTGSGVLDVAREVQLRLKHWGYAYKMSNNTAWADRAWLELNTAMGNNPAVPYGTTTDNNWNTGHFLDVGEFTAAFGIGYDWFYDAWTEEQRTALRNAIVTLGLNYGVTAYAQNTWWTAVNGNWNCVCGGGLLVGALAIANEDTTGQAAAIISAVVPNLRENCAQGPQPGGTWSETPNYWYFGTTGHVQAAAALLTATGSTQDLLTSNANMNNSGLYHMYVTGNAGKFDYGDTGPNKFTATANGLLFYGSQLNIPAYTLYQRDRSDAPEPMSMLYYDPQATGTWFANLPLDRNFDDAGSAWATMRSSWTDTEGIYVAMKTANLTGHQAHGDLDAGTFVLDALGQRWAGELGNGNYLADNYFSNETQSSMRWWYYRKSTWGQNVLVVDDEEQTVDVAAAARNFGSTGDSQSAFSFTPANSSTAFYTADLAPFYGGAAVKRGIRLLNGRKQVLLRDEVTSTASVNWRMHTNATVTMSNNNQTATLALGGKELTVQLRAPATGSFFTLPAVRDPSQPTLPSDAASQDQPNDGTTVLTVELGAGAQVIEVLFNPSWDNMAASDFVTPADVALDSWSLTSH